MMPTALSNVLNSECCHARRLGWTLLSENDWGWQWLRRQDKRLNEGVSLRAWCKQTWTTPRPCPFAVITTCLVLLGNCFKQTTTVETCCTTYILSQKQANQYL